MPRNWSRERQLREQARERARQERARRRGNGNAERRSRTERAERRAAIREVEGENQETTDSIQPTLPRPLQDSRGDTSGETNPAGLPLEQGSVLEASAEDNAEDTGSRSGSEGISQETETERVEERIEEEEAPGGGEEEEKIEAPEDEDSEEEYDIMAENNNDIPPPIADPDATGPTDNNGDTGDDSASNRTADIDNRTSDGSAAGGNPVEATDETTEQVGETVEQMKQRYAAQLKQMKDLLAQQQKDAADAALAASATVAQLQQNAATATTNAATAAQQLQQLQQQQQQQQQQQPTVTVQTTTTGAAIPQVQVPQVQVHTGVPVSQVQIPTAGAPAIKMDAGLTHLMKEILHYTISFKSPTLASLEHAGCETFTDFRALPYDYKFTYPSPNVGILLNPTDTDLSGVAAEKIKAIIAFAINKVLTKDSTKDTPTSWTSQEFEDWRRDHFAAWKALHGNTYSQFPRAPAGGVVSTYRKTLESFQKIVSSIDYSKYPTLTTDEDFIDFRFKLENISKRQQFERVLTDKYATVQDFEASLIDPDDIALLKLQAAHLVTVWDQKLKTVRGAELARTNKDDPIKAWHDLLIHQKGSDASLSLASNLMKELFTLCPQSFGTKQEFLSAYDDKIDRYNRTSKIPLNNDVRLQCLRLAVMQQKELYLAYTSFLALKRSGGNSSYQPQYEDFYEHLRGAAELEDVGRIANRNRGIKANSTYAQYFEDISYDEQDDDISVSSADRRSTRSRGGPRGRDFPRRQIKLPADLMEILPESFMREFINLPIWAQHRLLNFGTKRTNKSFIARSAISEPSFDQDSIVYICNAADSIADSSFDDDSSFALSEYSGGETDDDLDDQANTPDSDDDESDVETTVNQAKSSLRRASGMKPHHRNQQRIQKQKRRPVKQDKMSSLPQGAPTRVLANEQLYICREDGTRISGITRHRPQGRNNPKGRKQQLKISMAKVRSYEFFSGIPTTTYTTQVNLRNLLYAAILSLIDGGANGCIGGINDMTILRYYLDHKRVNVGVADGHQMTDLRLAVTAAYMTTKTGPIIGIFNNVAVDARIKQSILSCIQLRAAGNLISDVPEKLGGLQMIQTNTNHLIPIAIQSGLPYIQMRPVTKKELNDPTIPHVMMTPEGDWNPRIYDDDVGMDEVMKRLPSTPIEATDFFYKQNGDLNISSATSDFRIPPNECTFDEPVSDGNVVFNNQSVSQSDVGITSNVSNNVAATADSIIKSDFHFSNFSQTCPTATTFAFENENFKSSSRVSSDEKLISSHASFDSQVSKQDPSLDRESDRELDRGTGRESDRGTGRESDRESDRGTDRESDRESNLKMKLSPRESNLDKKLSPHYDPDTVTSPKVKINKRNFKINKRNLISDSVLDNENSFSTARDPNPSKKTDGEKTIRWKKKLTETNDGEPFVPEHKRDRKIEFNKDEIADEHPNKTGVVIERDGCLLLERCLNGDISYDSVPVLEDAERSMSLISQSSEYWSACKSDSFLASINVPDDCNITPKHLASPAMDDDIGSDPCVFDHEYWADQLGFDNEALQLCIQGSIDYAKDFNVSSSDLIDIHPSLGSRFVEPNPKTYEKFRSNFCWAPIETIKRTLKHTTQNMTMPASSFLRKRYQSTSPYRNILHRRNEYDATDMIYSNVACAHTGSTKAHIFVGSSSKLLDAYGTKDGSEDNFLQAFQKRCVTRGPPTKLVADNAPLYRSAAITTYLLDMFISLWQCETKKQHQNIAERRWNVVKRYTNRTLDKSGAPPSVWLFAMLLVIFCLNHMVDPVLADGTQTPLGYATGTVRDVSPLLQFSFWQSVYYLTDPTERSFPGKSEEKRGKWVGISENIGAPMTFVIISNDGKGSVIQRSVLRSATDPNDKNLRADKEAGAVDSDTDIPNIIVDDDGSSPNNASSPTTSTSVPEPATTTASPRRSPRSHPVPAPNVTPSLYPVGTKIHRHINRRPVSGTVTAYNPQTKWYRIQYDNGDSQDLTPGQVRNFLLPAVRPPSMTDPSAESPQPQRIKSLHLQTNHLLYFANDSVIHDAPTEALANKPPDPDAVYTSSSFFDDDISIDDHADTVVFLKRDGENTDKIDAHDDRIKVEIETFFDDDGYLVDIEVETVLQDDDDSNHSDGEKTDAPPPWNELDDFIITLRDEHGNERLDKDGKPIQVVCKPPTDLLGRVFLTKPDPRGNRHRARVVEVLKDFEDQVDINTNPISRKFRIQLERGEGKEAVDDIMAYNEILNHIEREENISHPEWSFRRILMHQHTPRNHPDRINSDYNVQILWETGAITTESVDDLAKEFGVDLALYGKENNLLGEECWKRFKHIADRSKHLERLVKQAKLRSFRTKPKFKYGFEVPRNYQHALELDRIAGNNKWRDANVLEHKKLAEYNVFEDRGMFAKHRVPKGFQLITVHTVFDVKHDGRFRARVVANGNLTDVPLESVYSGVVSLRGLRTILFLSELNGMTPWATDISSAYLEAFCDEKVCIRAGPEFGDLEGHLLLVVKALYGLRRSGVSWAQLLAECLEGVGFVRSKADDSIFMRPREDGTAYEYVACYVDDLAFITAEPEKLIKELERDPYNFEMKGSGPINFHLGCGFGRDDDNTLYMDPSRYIDKMIDSYERLFGEQPNQTVRSPLEKGDHPELDTSAFLDEDGIEMYQSLIGSMQWCVSIGRWDVGTAVMTLSSFRAQPRQGHLDRAKRVYSYLKCMKHFKIRFRVDEPDFDGVPHIPDYVDWGDTPYGKHTEDIPSDAPKPLGKRVILSHYYDASLMHDVLSGKAVTGILHFYNKTPIDWYCKKQATSETSTYGAEFLAARTCIEQIIDHRNYLRYLGVEVYNIGYMWGDNESQIMTSTVPHAKLHKRHQILSFHYVRSIISQGWINLRHIPSSYNASDPLTKHWGYQSVWKTILQPLMHHQGDTRSLVNDDTCLVDGSATIDEIISALHRQWGVSNIAEGE